MDHPEVLRMQTAEGYVLGELESHEREEFEEHFFECPDCASDLEVLTTFLLSARAVFEDNVQGIDYARRSPTTVRQVHQVNAL